MARLEPEHLIWLASRVTLLIALVFLPVLILSPGLVFWVDLLRVIPIMWMGGMCSEDMMVRMITSLINFGVLAGALTATRALTWKTRFAFERYRHGTNRVPWDLPGPTVWQARLRDLAYRSALSGKGSACLFWSARRGRVDS